MVFSLHSRFYSQHCLWYFKYFGLGFKFLHSYMSAAINKTSVKTNLKCKFFHEKFICNEWIINVVHEDSKTKFQLWTWFQMLPLKNNQRLKLKGSYCKSMEDRLIFLEHTNFCDLTYHSFLHSYVPLTRCIVFIVMWIVHWVYFSTYPTQYLLATKMPVGISEYNIAYGFVISYIFTSYEVVIVKHNLM